MNHFMKRYRGVLLLIILMGSWNLYGNEANRISLETSFILKGKVVDKEDKMPLIGVNILDKNKGVGEVTDFDGNFSIEVEEGTVLVFSYIGMKPLEYIVTTASYVEIELVSDAFGLEEIVVSGVATATPRKNLTISVDNVNGEKLKDAHAVSAANALQDKVAGLRVVSANGLPGSGTSFRLRGSTSLVGNQSPMIMLDGVVINTNLADINLDDVANIEVVKGAAAAALYGSQAGNGVIVLTSKRGLKEKEGSSKVIVRTEMGFQDLAKSLELSTHHPYVLAEDWQDYPYTRYDGVFYYDDVAISGSRILAEDGYADQEYAQIYDNQELVFKQGFYHTEYIGVEGREKRSNFLISFENNRQGGILFGTEGYSRNNIKINLDRFVGDKIKISTSNLLLKARSKNPASYKTFNDVLFISPDVDLLAKNSDGTDYNILPDRWGIAENPLYPLAYRDKTADRHSVIGNVKLTYYINDWLNAEGQYNYEYRDKSWTTITPKGYKVNNGQNEGGTLYKADYNEFNQYLQTTLNFNRRFNDWTTKGKFSYLYENTSYTYFEVLGKDFIFDDVPQLNNTDPTLSSMESYQGDIVTINYFAIADWDYKSKYLFSALYRLDGSSLFGENVRWNPYYRASAAWRLTKDFNIPEVDELKLRVSYGTSGQRPGFSNQYETWNISGGQASKQSNGNKNLKPSTTKEFEVAMNAEFLTRFSLEASYSNSLTENAIAQAPLPSHYGGYPYQWQNVGTLGGNALEMSLQMNLINSKDFNWTGTIIFDRIRQEVVSLKIPEYKTGPNNAFFIREGEVFGVIYGNSWVRSLDVMANQLPEGGNISDYEINSDGYVILAGTEGTTSETPILLDADRDGLADKIEIGDGNSNFNMSWGNNLSFKGLNFYFLWAWKNGGDVYNYTRQYTFRDLRAIEFDQSGKAESEKKAINYYSAFYQNTEINSYFLEDGSFLKLRELALSYQLPTAKLKQWTGNTLSGLRVGFQARNLLTITNYKGYDPEVSSGSDLSNYPFDNFGYPNFRSYTASLKLTF